MTLWGSGAQFINHLQGDGHIIIGGKIISWELFLSHPSGYPYFHTTTNKPTLIGLDLFIKNDVALIFGAKRGLEEDL